MDIGTITGTISIDDQMSHTFEIAVEKVKEFAEEFDGAMGVVAAGATIALVALGAITAAVTALAVEGSEIQEVSAGFDRMAGSASNATEVLAVMREGTEGTISDFNLMKDANKLLASGVEASADTFSTLASAAKVLSKEGFGPVSDTMDMVTAAMQRGVARGGPLKNAIGDIKHAEDEMSASLATQGVAMDSANKLIADRQGLVTYLQKMVSDAGDQELTFADKLNQSKASFTNWLNQLELAVATSPNLARALDTVQQALSDAFGGSSQTLLNAIVAGVNHFADAVTAAVPYVVSFGNGVKYVWDLLSQTVTLFTPWAKGLASLVQPSVTEFFRGLQVYWTAFTDAIAKGQDYIEYFALRMDGMSSAAAHAQIASDNLTRAQLALAPPVKMVTESVKSETDAFGEQAPHVDAATLALEAHNKAVTALVLSMAKAGDTVSQGHDAFSLLTDKLKDNVAVQEQIIPMLDKIVKSGGELTTAEREYYIAVTATRQALLDKQVALLAVQGVTVQQIETLKQHGNSEEAIAVLLKTTTGALKTYETQLKEKDKTEQEGLKITTALWDTYSAEVLKVTGTTLEQQYQAIENWSTQQELAIERTAQKIREQHGDATAFVQGAYEALANVIVVKYKAVTDGVGGSTQAMRDSTKSALQEVADVMETKYEDALTHIGEWTTEDINKFHDQAIAAQTAADTWGTSMKSNADTAKGAIDGVTQSFKDQVKTVYSLMGSGNKDEAAALDEAQKQTFGTVGPGPVLSGIYNMLTQQRDQLMAAMGFKPQAVATPHFAEGGVVDLGENGPERVALPYGSTVFPTGAGPGQGTTIINQMSGLLLTTDPGGKRIIQQAVDEATSASLRKHVKVRRS